MRCPFCGRDETQVKDSRPTEDGTAVRRRRLCGSCGARFSTVERVHLRELVVVKSNKEKQTFDRDKIYRSIRIAVRKRGISDSDVELMSNAIVHRLERIGELEIPSQVIGQMIMEELMRVDMIAYIRFASVYRDFAEVGDFAEIVEAVKQKEKDKKD